MSTPGMSSSARSTEQKRYIYLTERGRARLPEFVADLNAELPPEVVQIIRDALKKHFGEEVSDHCDM